ncbi:MAG: hypothetical protein KGI56_01090 [Acidobacteriota bacterium]|nr:hypothetical protein [Acidobacteriota bacterium]
MTRETLPLPEACQRTLTALEADPLDPGRDAQAHLRCCPACAEARVLFLAQEEVPDPLAPAGYFDRLPGRILGKLPVRQGLSRRLHGLGWAAAAVLLMAASAGAFWAGRANRTPLVEANLPKPVDTVEITVPEEPFHDRDEEAAQLQTLSPSDMKALLQQMDAPAPAQR